MFKAINGKLRGASLLENYGRQVVRSQLKQRAENAIVEKNVNSKNIIELKSYFITSLVNRLSPSIESEISGVQQLSNSKDDSAHGKYDENKIREITISMERTLSYLHQLSDFAQLEAGILTVSPELICVNDIVSNACATAINNSDPTAPAYQLNFEDEPLYIIGTPEKLTQAFTNIFKYISCTLSSHDAFFVRFEKISETELTIIINNSRHNLPDAAVQQLLDSSNLVDRIMTLGADSMDIALPIAKTFIHIHNGHLSIENQAEGGFEINISFPLHLNSAASSISQ